MPRPNDIKLDGAVLSRAMAAVLIEHGNGPRPVVIKEKETVRALRARGLIYFNRVSRPTHTVVTRRGRKIAAELLRIQDGAVYRK
jgi:hypothetical protein